MKRNSLMQTYKVMHLLHNKRIPLLPSIIMRYIRIIYSCELPPSTKIGENTLFIHNGLGVVIHPDAVIGKGVRIYQNVSIAGRNALGTPVIEDNVFIGAGACVLGNIRIGANAKIGANAVVLKDVNPGTTVVGIPAK
jgi:serine O-acetyltransferase